METRPPKMWQRSTAAQSTSSEWGLSPKWRESGARLLRRWQKGMVSRKVTVCSHLYPVLLQQVAIQYVAKEITEDWHVDQLKFTWLIWDLDMGRETRNLEKALLPKRGFLNNFGSFQNERLNQTTDKVHPKIINTYFPLTSSAFYPSRLFRCERCLLTEIIFL